ncbi:hypothetical protein AURDEDRAFT_131227, partial [Auricularia subglabra TFB-10046 SS5]
LLTGDKIMLEHHRRGPMMILVAIGLAKTDDEAATYPLILSKDVRAAPRKGKGTKTAPAEAEQIVGDPVEWKFVSELKLQIGSCTDPTCKIDHCKVTHDGVYTQLTEFMFVHWGNHMTHPCWEPYHTAGMVQVTGNQIAAPPWPGAHAPRIDKLAEADKRADIVMEIMKSQAESTTQTMQMMVPLMQTFTDQWGHSTAESSIPAARGYTGYAEGTQKGTQVVHGGYTEVRSSLWQPPP